MSAACEVLTQVCVAIPLMSALLCVAILRMTCSYVLPSLCRHPANECLLSVACVVLTQETSARLATVEAALLAARAQEQRLAIEKVAPLEHEVARLSTELEAMRTEQVCVATPLVSSRLRVAASLMSSLVFVAIPLMSSLVCVAIPRTTGRRGEWRANRGASGPRRGDAARHNAPRHDRAAQADARGGAGARACRE